MKSLCDESFIVTNENIKKSIHIKYINLNNKRLLKTPKKK